MVLRLLNWRKYGKEKIVRRKFSESQKKKILQQASKSNLILTEFCRRQDIATSVFYAWQKEFQGKKPSHKSKKRGGPHTPEERKQAVEAFLKSGMTQVDFAKTWGCSNQTINTWIQQYRNGGFKGLEGSSFQGENSHKRGPKGISQQLKNQIVDTTPLKNSTL